MLTVRWLKIIIPITLRVLSEKMLSNQYTDDSGKGFLLSSTISNRVSGKYIEKIINKSTVIDPFGNETESVTTDYYVLNFTFDDSNYLEIKNPPRSMKKFISNLRDLVGLGLEVSEVSIDPLEWVNNIENSMFPVVVKHISASGIVVPKNALAKISISGEKDIRDEFDSMIGSKHRKIDSIKFISSYDDRQVTAELTNTGAIKFSGHTHDSFLYDVRKCLGDAINQ